MLSEWQSVTTLPPLEFDELQLWRINLVEATANEDTYRKQLSPTEVARADRLRAGLVRMQFLASRAALRFLLGNLLSLPPNQVPITLTSYGKPGTPPVNGVQVFFNCAHSRETILIGISRTSEIGVDIEYFDRMTDVLEIAHNSFTSNEIREIELCSDPPERQRAFFRCWTRKEAVVKADGRGLSIPLTAVEVPVLAPARSAPVLVTAETSAQTWFVSDIDLGDELAGAYAISIPNTNLRTLAFPLALFSSGFLRP